MKDEEKSKQQLLDELVATKAELKLIRDELIREEEKYRTLVDNIGVGISVISPNMEILSLNRQMERWFPDIDVSEKPICYKAFNDPPRDNVCSYCPTFKTLKAGKVYESVTETTAQDGIVNFRIISSPIKDGKGEIISAIEVVEDTTERNRAEDARNLYQKHLEAIKDIAALAGSTLELEDVLHRILSGTLEASNATVGMVFIIDQATECLKWGASIGLSEAFVNDYRDRFIQPGEGLTGRIYQSGETIYIPLDSSHDPRIARPVIEAEGLNSFIGVAIQAGGETVGVMNILSRPPDILGEDVITLVSAIGLQVGWAIRNAQFYEKLKTSVTEKEILLREIHHRVKNNMAIISALLQLQARHSNDDNIDLIFRDSQNRISSMALVHEKLYQTQDFSTIDLREYVEDLVRHLLHTYGKKEGDIGLVLSIDDINLNIDTMIPCGLIINELVSNSIKYAFKGVERPEISISLNADDTQATLIFSDNGIGIPEHIDFQSSETLGLKIVNMLATQLKGTAELNRGGGTRFTINFKQVA
jgi:PAS domain S-box-containing protein